VSEADVRRGVVACKKCKKKIELAGNYGARRRCLREAAR
jgi:hypothetical protein